MRNLILYTVSGTNFVYIVLVSSEIEGFNRNSIPPLLLVSEWLY